MTEHKKGCNNIKHRKKLKKNRNTKNIQPKKRNRIAKKQIAENAMHRRATITREAQLGNR